MHNQEILAKAIQKALDSGWLYPNHTADTKYRTTMFGSEVSFATYVADKLEASPINEVYEVIYDKDFAKALWGEEWEELPNSYPHINERMLDDPTNYRSEGATVDHTMHRTGNYGWQYHLQRMVIAEDPIEYLANNI